MALNFTAIDFETANGSRASACAVGLVKVRDSVVVNTASWLIKPPPGHDTFLEFNTLIHGIHTEDVRDAASWPEVFRELDTFTGSDALVAHNAPFDIGVLRSSCEVAQLECPPYYYLCSLQVARKTYQLDSYRLPKAAAAAGFLDFEHHQALADAQASAAIMIDAARRHRAANLYELSKHSRVHLNQIAKARA